MVKLTIHYWDYTFLITGNVGSISEHKHHAIQVFLDNNSLHCIEVNGEILHDSFIVIASDVSHRVINGSKSQQTLLIDADCSWAKHISHSLLKGKDYYTEERPDAVVDLNDFSVINDRIATLCSGTTCRECPPIDMRITKSLEYIGKSHNSFIKVGEVASSVNLSESRFMHLFYDNIGIPLRRYLLWRRLVKALSLATEGHKLTYIAYETGFSDSAHLSRTFKSHFGINMSKIFRNSRFIQFYPL